ncbi:lipopolysaccharide biosynthesis protein [Sphingomonas sp. RHCKR47]|uniref:lipopolysaccharide biosynthesis protein n=1 Tax=Sphingomonas citricola TaxID=2862498 RepID=UPI001C66A0A3|nr:lipopolysaccharide biosynthesis protein [Sphingomonas citricola]MBW6524365.1 lipopolysaccharide biosynthesis protein [Sphingomonas citricola]
MSLASPAPTHSRTPLVRQIRNAIVWRSGSQILSQLVQWTATFLVIRILSPSDYGLFAMSAVVLAFTNMLDGYGLASALIRQPEVTRRDIRQLFGLLLLLNGTLAVVQVIVAPLLAAYYRQPIVADMLRVQSLLYLTTPFIALPSALLSRQLDFSRQAKVNIVASLMSASTALIGALSGWGVWTLVAAPGALYLTRAVGLTWAARALVWPLFRFDGADQLMRFGGLMALGQLFWFLQSQSDVFIAGRTLSPHLLGIYTTSLFLAQIFVSKFVPPLNEVAFSAYARIQHDRDARATAFLKAAQLVMLAALPFYVGLATTAEPLVHAVLGEKWGEVVPVVRLLAFAMPVMTLQVLYSPACDAVGRPDVGVVNGAIGAGLLTLAFLIGVRGGVTGLATAWIVAYPLYLAIGSRRALPVIGVTWDAVARAIAPAALCAGAMALAVLGLDHLLPPLCAVPRLVFLVAAGAVSYLGLLLGLARGTVREVVALVRT